MIRRKLKYFAEYISLRLSVLLLSPLTASSNKSLIFFLLKIIKPRKKLIFKQLKMVFPEKSGVWLEKTIDEFYYNLASLAVEFFFIAWDKTEIKINNQENFDKAISFKRGVILVSGHIGNWELCMAHIAKNTTTSGIVKSVKNPLVDGYINRKREKANVGVIYLKNIFRQTIRAMKNRELVCIMLDQNARNFGVRIPFLGHKASTFISPAKLAIKTGAVLLPAFSTRERATITTHYLTPITTENFTDDEESIIQLTRVVNQKLEEMILKYPSQWFWIHKRWS